MAQHDYILENQPGAAFRGDLNGALAAIVSQNSGATEPSPSYPFQWWADTTTGVLKLRNSANNDWVSMLNMATGAAINGLPTYSSVPSIYSGDEVTVTAPHLRKMVWNGTKYVRAPWHPVGQAVYSYGATLSGALPIRADLSYNQADYPDLAEYLELSGTGTFSLIEARGEFIRVLDNGRGKDVGRVIRSTQADAIRDHTHHYNYNGIDNTNGYAGIRLTGNIEGSSANTLGMSGGGGSETRPSNIALPLWLTY